VGKLADWRTIAYIGAGLSAALLVAVVLILPETPAFLVAQGKEEEARRILTKVRDTPAEVERDMAQLSSSALATSDPVDESVSQLTGFVADEPEKVKKQGGLRGLFVKGVRWPFAIGCLLMVAQQFSGINAVIFYSGNILALSGMDDPNMGGLIIMAVQVAMTGVSVLLMDRAGRRSLLLTSLSGMSVAATLLAIFYLNNKEPSWLALVALILYIIFFSLGLGPIPWLIMGEIFPSHVRATASSVATLLNWSLSFIVTLFFETIAEALSQAGVFFLFAGICVGAFAFVLTCVPETRGKSFEEIEAIFK